MIQAFNEICGYSPDERGMVLLQRLPGLGVDRADEDSRKFVDQAFADACRAGDLVSFVDGPFDFERSVLTDMECSIDVLGIEVAAYIIAQRGFKAGKMNAAVGQARRSGSAYLVADLIRLTLESGFGVREHVTIDGLWIPLIELGTSTADSSMIEFKNCFFSRVEIDASVDVSKLPFFEECYIEEMDGIVSSDDLPSGRFDDACSIDRFTSSTDTNRAVLKLDRPLGIRVCITVLKKLYQQAGSGRKENALHRGLDSHARRLVPDVLRVLQTEGLARPYPSKAGKIWIPDRSSRTRVGRMIAAPAASQDAVLEKCGSL